MFAATASATLQTQRSRSQTRGGRPSGALHPTSFVHIMLYHTYLPWASALALLVTSGTAHAVEPTPVPGTDAPPDKASSGDTATGGGGIQLADSSTGGKTDTGPKADNTRRNHSSDTPWIKRYRPTRHQLEFGIFGGVLLPNTNHELYDPDQVWQPYKKVAPDIGLRAGYYPLSFLGLEIEGALMPTKLRDGSSRALLGGFRGYGVLQLPYRVAPFVLLGFGLLGSNGSSIGNDFDPALHFGGGVKFYINRLLAVRLDVRDNVTAKYQVEAGRTHHVEVLLGLSFLLNRARPVPKMDVDSDGDGYLDRLDRCVNTPGIHPDGCPKAAPIDSDGDGVFDPQDSCIDVPGVAPHGCPDSDGDTFLDSVDKCPQVAGIAPDGCPSPDTDGDGILDAVDKCIEVPETTNGYKDKDGCPDEVPKEVAKFAGVIKGIYFDVNKTTIKPASRKTLDAAVKVLKDFEDVNVEISGHTDSDGDRVHNLDLSRGRAESVRNYLVDKGIADTRLLTRGAGPDEPIAPNDSKKNKALNRRIEFKLQDGSK
jgi:outer membrane protein OmpA-like peptidoglycan-associated protein